MGGELTFLEKIMREERALKKGVKEKGKLPVPGNPKLKKKRKSIRMYLAKRAVRIALFAKILSRTQVSTG